VKHAVLLLLAVLLGAAVIAAAVTLSRRDETDPVRVEDATEQRERAERRSAVDKPDEQNTLRLRPAPGTYTYAGSGRESIDVLGGSRHVFPARVPVNISHDRSREPVACERWTMEFLYARQRTDRRTFCTNKAGVREESFRKSTEFFRQVEQSSFRCTQPAFRWDRGAKPGTSWAYRCAGNDRVTDQTATYVGREPVQVGETAVMAHRVRVVTMFSGAAEGQDISEYWYGPSGLHLRWTTKLDTTTDSVLGQTRLREQTDYTLTRVRPA